MNDRDTRDIEERELALAAEHPRGTERRRLLPYVGALNDTQAYARLPERDRDAIVRWAEIRRRILERGVDHDPANLADPLLPTTRLRSHVIEGERIAAGTPGADDDGGDLIKLVARIRSASRLRVLAWPVPPYDNRTYLIVDARKECVCIDPSMGEKEVMRELRAAGLKLLAILDTHGHEDHIWDNAKLQEATRARLAIHSADAYRLDPATRPPTGPERAPRSVADDLLEEGPLGYLADVRMEALHTPGHTEGSTCFYLPDEGTLFSGDVLFAGNIGRIDLPGGDAGAMEQSLARVASLPPGTRVYPGHGRDTTIAAELGWLRGFRFG